MGFFLLRTIHIYYICGRFDVFGGLFVVVFVVLGMVGERGGYIHKFCSRMDFYANWVS